jgi:phytoene dehydrogenase-like protein
MSETADFVIVGGGVAGLVAGAILSREGARVALFEKHSKLGGYAQYFGKEPTFDSTLHLVGGCHPGGWLHTALSEAGALGEVELVRLDPMYHARFPRHRLDVPGDVERLRQEFSAQWPAEAPGIQRFFSDMAELGQGYLRLVDGPPTEGLAAKYQDRTLAQMLDDFTRDAELRSVLSGLWIFAGLPPERLSALHYAMLWHTFHAQGSAAIRGGAPVLTSALAGVITRAGGTVETRMPVTRIRRDRGRIQGVLLEDGREYSARAIICTASPYDVFEELLAVEGQSAAGYPPLRQGFIASTSALAVHLMVEGDLAPPARTTLLHTGYDLGEIYGGLLREQPEFGALVCTVLDEGDSARVPEGKHMVSLFSLAPYSRHDNWSAPFDTRRGPAYRTLPPYQELKERLADGLVERAEEVLPGLRERSTYRRVGTPLTLERYTFNTGGAAYGWAHVPEQSGGHRPGPRTTFRGLYLAGHWTFPGGGVAAAATSGRIAARTVLADHP